MSTILWSFGGLSLLLGIIKTVVYLNKTKDFKGYKTTTGCVVEHLSKEGHIEFDDEEFGMDAINYDEDDHLFLAEDGINTVAGVVEFLVKGKKVRVIDSINDTNLMPIGSEVVIKYNPKKPKEAFVIDAFDGTILYAVGAFLMVLGTIMHLIK